MPFRAGQYKITIEEIKKMTRYGNCHKVGYWHREYPEPPRKKEQNLLETEEAVFCGLLEADGPPPEESGQGLHGADGPPAEQPELSLPEADGLQPEKPELSFPEADGLQPEEPELSEPANHSSLKTGGMKQILRQATLALTELEAMWKEFITQLQDGQQMTGQQVFEQFAVQILDPNNPLKIINKRPLQRLASLMGVTKK